MRKIIFCVSGIAFLLFAAGADSLLDTLGFAWFAFVGFALLASMATSASGVK